MDLEHLTSEELESKRRELLQKLKGKIEELKLKAEGSSALASSPELQTLSNEFEQLLKASASALDPSQATLRIYDGLDKVFTAEKVGHPCDLCQTDLAVDPQRPNAASLVKLEEVCVLACGHVYHFKCLKGTTLDLDSNSAEPSCIFCIS